MSQLYYYNIMVLRLTGSENQLASPVQDALPVSQVLEASLLCEAELTWSFFSVLVVIMQNFYGTVFNCIVKLC